MPELFREGLGPLWTPSRALTGPALHTKGHPCYNVVTAQGPQMKGNTAKTGVLLMGSKEGATQDFFAAHLGTRLASAEAYAGVTGRPLSLKAMQMLEVTGRDAGGETQAHRALTATCCQSPCHSVPSLQLIPQAVLLLGHGDSVFILFCLNELVCVRLGNGGRGILETSTWGMYPWRSECQDTFGWLKTIKVQRAALCQLCSSVSSANTSCVVLGSPQPRRQVLLYPGTDFFPSLWLLLRESRHARAAPAGPSLQHRQEENSIYPVHRYS